jgi:hypothetical chaperone protein
VFRYNYPTIDIEERITRAGFEASSAYATERIVLELDATLKRAGIRPEQVDSVCCTGGTARLPVVEQALGQRFGRDKLSQFENFHSVIRGLTAHAQAAL